MATITQITEGLAANLTAIDGVQVSAWMLASPTPPAIHVVPPAIEYHQAMQNGMSQLTFTVQAFVALNSDIASQKRLAEFRAPTGTGSVKAALEADKTLGGVAQHLLVKSSPEPSVLTFDGGRQVLACDFEVVVIN